MKRRKNDNRKVLVITLIILTVLGVLSQPENSPVSGGINLATKWLFRLTASAAATLDSASAGDPSAEAEALRRENAELRRQMADYLDVKAENERLWKYYDLKKTNPSYQIVPSNVIRRDVNDDFYSFTLDAGTSVGVKVNAPVITEDGLVGWVCQADAATCKVKTVLSPDTKATVQDKRTGDSGILSGSVSLSDNNLTGMNKLAGGHQLRQGDMIVTAGTGGLYPAGLLVGEVQSVEFNKYDASRSAVIKPYVDVRNITSAAVITGFNETGRVVRADEE